MTATSSGDTYAEHAEQLQQSDPAGSGEPAGPQQVLIYSDDRTVREAVRMSLGRRPAPGMPELSYTECATESAVVSKVDTARFDLLILDGEAVPAGGLGICRQLKDEIYHCPPVLVLLGRPQDAWLAIWSRAEAAVGHPIDPFRLAEVAAGLLRERSGLTSG